LKATGAEDIASSGESSHVSVKASDMPADTHVTTY